MLDGSPSMVRDGTTLMARYEGFENYTALMATAFDDARHTPLLQWLCSGPAGFCHLPINGLRGHKGVAIGLNPYDNSLPFARTEHTFIVMEPISVRAVINPDDGMTVTYLPAEPQATEPETQHSLGQRITPATWVITNPNEVEQGSLITVMWQGFRQFSKVKVALVAPDGKAPFQEAASEMEYVLFYMNPRRYPVSAGWHVETTGLVPDPDSLDNSAMIVSNTTAVDSHWFDVVAKSGPVPVPSM